MGRLVRSGFRASGWRGKSELAVGSSSYFVAFPEPALDKAPISCSRDSRRFASLGEMSVFMFVSAAWIAARDMGARQDQSDAMMAASIRSQS